MHCLPAILTHGSPPVLLMAPQPLLAAALSQHEELNAVLGRYQELLDKAEVVSPSRKHLALGADGGSMQPVSR